MTEDRVWQPMRLTRVFCTGAGAFAVLAGGALLWGATVTPLSAWFFVSFGVLCVLFGVLVALRSMRMAVVLSPDRVLVRGVFWDRSIPRASVREVDDHLAFPLIRWTAADGRRRTTPVQSMTTESGALEVFRTHARDGIADLKDWAAGAPAKDTPVA